MSPQAGHLSVRTMAIFRQMLKPAATGLRTQSQYKGTLFLQADRKCSRASAYPDQEISMDRRQEIHCKPQKTTPEIPVPWRLSM
jgi:hypothetical protein